MNHCDRVSTADEKGSFTRKAFFFEELGYSLFTDDDAEEGSARGSEYTCGPLQELIDRVKPAQRGQNSAH